MNYSKFEFNKLLKPYNLLRITFSLTSAARIRRVSYTNPSITSFKGQEN